MSTGRYIKTKSNYTFKKKHLSTGNGDIFERDYMTIVGEPGNNTNFKFVRNNIPVLQKKHNISGKEVFNGIGKDSKEEYEKSLAPKPDYESLQDFAYYGPAVELVHSSLNEIIERYPISVISGEDGTFPNDFGIDFFTANINRENVNNPYRFFSASFSDYEISYKGKVEPVFSWESEAYHVDTGSYSAFDDKCEDLSIVKKAVINGSYVIEYKYDMVSRGDWVYTVYGHKTSRSRKNAPLPEVEIRLKEKIRKAEIDKLSPFERILVNEETTPKFCSKFYTYAKDDDMTYRFKKKFVWPCIDGVNPSISARAYNTYIDSLYKLAAQSDEFDSDILWRKLTHDSMKNLDWTFTREGEESEEVEIDSSRLSPMLKMWGRQYDDVKLYIDSIGCSNSITYDEKRNAPDSSLPKLLNISGWEVKHAYTTGDKDIRVNMNYPGDTRKKDYIDADRSFLRNLKINSPYIMRKKGTVDGICSVLSMFGFDTDEYEINEYIGVAYPNSGEKYPLYEDVKKYNCLKNSFDMSKPDEYLQGLPLKRVSLSDDEKKDYVIPWFNSDERYDRGPYFQYRGGWGLVGEKEVVNPLHQDHKTVIISDENFKIYEETYPIIKIVDNMDKLSQLRNDEIYTGDVVFVTDITKILTDYVDKYGNKITEPEKCTNYFILKDRRLMHILGYESEGKITGYGWKNVPADAFDPEEWEKEKHRPGYEEDLIDAKKVMYVESLKEDSTGNNPHKGSSRYDDGVSYRNYFKKLFYPSDFSALDSEQLEEMEKKNIGFTVKGPEKFNNKCLFFKDNLSGNESIYECDKIVDISPEYQKLFRPESDLLGVDDESVANSVVNLKNLVIKFNYPKNSGEEFKNEFRNFVLNKVMYYVKQVVPATSILRCKFGEEGELTKAEIKDIYRRIYKNIIIDIL